jgi:hypothetical protein
MFSFQHSFRLYVMDVISLVVDSVSEDLTRDIESDDIAIRVHAQDRKAALDRWRNLDNPLAYSNDAYSHLVKITVTDRAHLSHGLQLSHLGQKSVTWFAQQIMESIKDAGNRCLPPFWKTCRSKAVLKTAILEAEKMLSSTADQSSIQDTIIDFLVKSASFARVCNIPWSPDPTGAHGRPFTTVTHTRWVNLGKTQLPSRTLNANPTSLSLQQATHSALAQDSQADWSCIGVSLQNLCIILNRQVLPQEWDIDSMTWPSGADASYVQDTYIWVRDNFDGSLPLHKTAIIVALVFSKLLPKVCHSGKPQHVPSHGNTSQFVRNTPWVATTSTNRKGMTNPIPFVTMMTTFIIALYESASPLRTYMASHGGNIGNP